MNNTKFSFFPEEVILPKNILVQSSRDIEFVYVEEKGEFGSLRMSKTVQNLLDYIRQSNDEGFLVMPVFDSSSIHVQNKPPEQRVENIEQRLNSDHPDRFPLLEMLKKQLDEKRGGDIVTLSKVEDSYFHLLTLNNVNIYGFPGAWIPYYDEKSKFQIFKTEPILIVPMCYSCQYGLNDKISSILENNPKSNVIKATELALRRMQQPPNCPELSCFDYKHHQNRVYANIVYRIKQEFSEDDHRIVPEKIQLGITQESDIGIAKIVGRLHNGRMYQP